jgi:hypothetical protein
VHRELAAPRGPRGPRGVRSCFLHQCPLYRSQRRFRSQSALDRVAVDVMWGAFIAAGRAIWNRLRGPKSAAHPRA